jgi:ubiquinone/menaquinone biosynthesis C-methylase UbiE
MDYEGSNWRAEFWPSREYEDRAERIALSHLLPPAGNRLVEIGAGFGRLADLYRGYDQVILLDYARSMLKDAVAQLGNDPRFIFVAADLYNLPFTDNAIDTAVTVRVLHHIAEIPRAFAEVSRVVRPHGTYVTDFANKRHLKAILKYWLKRGNGNSPFSHEPYEFVKLNFDYHPSYIRNNLLRQWFHVHEERAVSTFRIGALKRTVPASLLASVDGLIQSPTARLELSPSLFLRAESEKPGAPQINPTLWRCLNCASSTVKEQPDPPGLLCESCGTFYPRVDGIYDFKSGSHQVVTEHHNFVG